MKFTTAIIIAFLGMSNALPAPYYGTDATPVSTTPVPCACAGNGIPIVTGTVSVDGSHGPRPTAPAYGPDPDEPRVSSSSIISVPTPRYLQPSGGVSQAAESSVPRASAIPQPSEGSDNGSGGDLSRGRGLNLGGLVSGILGGGKLPGLDISARGGLDLEGFLGGLTGLLEDAGHLDGSGHLNVGGLLDSLKGSLGGRPGGTELAAFCDQLKTALGGSGNIDLSVLVPGLEALFSGTGKFDVGTALGIDVGGLIQGLKLLLEASISSSGGLDIGALLVQLEGFLARSGHLNLGVGAGLELGSVIGQLKDLLSASGSGDLNISSILEALHGLFSGSVDLNGFVAACGKLPGGKLLVSLCTQLKNILIGIGIDLNAIAGQIVSVLGGFLEGSLNIGGSLFANGILDLSGLLSAVVKVDGGLGVSSLIGAVGSISGSIPGKVDGLLSGLLGGHAGGDSIFNSDFDK